MIKLICLSLLGVALLALVGSAAVPMATADSCLVTLTVLKDGTGNGLVSNGWKDFGWAIYCGEDCDHVFDKCAQLTGIALTAYPALGSEFAGWSGDCQPQSEYTCVMTMDSNRTVTATFNSLVEPEPPFLGNHGQWVRSQADKKSAARSDAGMPTNSNGH